MTTDSSPETSRPATPIPALTAAFAVLFVLSGACGLTYEVVWTRLLVQVFGVTAFAVSTVLVSFMGGMALGAAVLGRRADAARRPLRMFASLEAGVGAYALALPALLALADRLYSALFTALPDAFLLRSIIRFAVCLALLLVPTVLMGGTLPALGRGLLRHGERLGRGVGLLYFVNTLGAAIGCFLAGFWLLPHLGLRGTTLLAASFNAVVAVGAWLLDRRAPAAEPPGEAAPAEREEAVAPPTAPAAWPLIVAAGSGMTALAFEVVWFRVLVLVFGSTVYSFSAMLSVFLLGLALGSALLGPIADRARRPVRLLALTQGAVGLFALLGSLAVNVMPAAFLRIIAALGLDFDGMNRTKLLLSFLTLLPPALAFGGTFPVAVRLAASRTGGTGSRIGRVYAWNTVGAIVGSFGAGFLLLPSIGSERTLDLVIAVSLALALGSVFAEPGPVRPRFALPVGLGVAVLLAATVFGPPWDRRLLGAGPYFEPRQFFDPKGGIALDRVVSDYTLTTYTEGYNDTIISFRSPKGRFITVNGSTTASDQFEDMFSQRMLGHLPAALHPGPIRKACIVGLGAGVTAGALGLYEIDRLVVVELEKGVFVASRFFENENHHVLDNPAVAVRIDDGRNYLKLTRERFDVISSAPNFPSLTGSGALYSREFFELARRRLAPGGVMCQFAPIWRLRTEELKSIVGTFADVFPHVRVFSTGLSLVMLGREEPFPPVDLDELTRRVERPAVRDSLRGIGVRGPVELLSFYEFDESEARRFAAGAPRNTDDDPRIEFYAPRALFSSTVGTNLAELSAVRPGMRERVARLGLTGEYAASWTTLASAYQATTDAEVLLSRGEVEKAMELAVPAAESGQRYARYLVADRAERAGLELQREGRLDAARGQFAIAVHFEPDRLDSLLGLGYVDLFLGRLDEADAVLSRALESFPRSSGAAYRLGLVREGQGRTEEAEGLYRRAIELQPHRPTAYALLGRLALVRGDAEAALGRFRAALDRGDDTEGTRLGAIDALIALGRTDEAFELAERAARSFPSSPDVFAALASAADRAGREAVATSARKRRSELLEALPASAAPKP